MQLAIGDVVRDRTDFALGTVAGVAHQAGGRVVAVFLPNQTVRLCPPGDLDVVGRYVKRTTTREGLVALSVLVLSVLAAGAGSAWARELGAGWPLAILAGLGGHTAVMTAYQWALRLIGPRRFHV